MSDEDRFRVLHALKLRGVGDAAALADITGQDEGAAQSTLEPLVEAEAVRARRGRVGGYALTRAGREQHAELLAARTDAGVTETAETVYGAFLPLNGTFKQLCTNWQAGAGDDDARSDIVDRLGELHDELMPSLAELAAAVDRFGRYADRLDAALARVRDGDPDAFLKPMTGSYHDVWMELHADLLLACGRERGDQDE